MPVQVVLSFAQSLIAPVLTATLLSMLAYDPDFRLRRDQARYCASLTCSSQSTTLPSSASAIAMCVIAVVGAAPCQCFSPGGNQTTSPGRICSTGPPSRCARPLPAVTIRVCPSGCVCQAVRAPGSNVTLAPLTRAGSGARAGEPFRRPLPGWLRAVSLDLHGRRPFVSSYDLEPRRFRVR